MARITSNEAAILVNVALKGTNASNYALINSLTRELKKMRLFAEGSAEYGKLDNLIGKMPKLTKPAKYHHMEWTKFQLWKLQTLKKAGVDYQPSNFVLTTFERMASKQEKKEWNALLG